jgi:hypothetical protein
MEGGVGVTLTGVGGGGGFGVGQITGRPLSKVLPCPNKGSRSGFVSVPQRRYVS